MPSPPAPPPDAPSAEPFGTLPDGTEATLYTLTSPSGARVRVTDYGGIIVSAEVPDRDGRLADVVLGFDSVEGYTSEAYREAGPYFGAIIGRFANRIDGGRFTLDGRAHQLATNAGPNHLHGGDVGFDQRLWDVEPFASADGAGLRLSRTSPDGEEGYPGTLRVTVTYTLTPDDRLTVDYEATTDAPTILNLTQHTYFNLTGDPSEGVLGHELALQSDAFMPVDDSSIPTGEVRSVDGTPFDFRQPATLGARIDADDEQVRLAGGYDHNFVLAGDGLAEAARVTEPASGRALVVETTEPGVQLYTGNHLDGSLVGKGDVRYETRAGFCLETQHPPDAPNQPGFPSVVLRPGETYASRTVFSFRTDG